MIGEKILELINQIETSCPCGARPESLGTHPHVSGCPVVELKSLLYGYFAQTTSDTGGVRIPGYGEKNLL